MKKSFLLFLFIGFAFCVKSQNQQLPKLSPRTREYLLDLKTSAAKSQVHPNYVYRQTKTGVFMSALIKVSASFPNNALDALGVHVGTRAGRVWSVMIPVENVEALSKTPGIEYIELDEPGCMKLDSVRRVTHVDSVQGGINLPMPYTGAGIVMGVVDAGFDFTNPVLYDTLGHSYRVKRIWEEKIPGTPPATFGYGNEITDTTAMKAAGTDFPTFSHATHVTGIAAGSGYGSSNTNDNKYRGMAFESDLVLVGIMPDSIEWQGTGMSDFLDGINYVFSYADSVNKPAVVNLSWGTVVGPHDGTSLFSQACDALTGPGRIFVCAAGNNGQDSIHIQKTFSTTDTLLSTFVGFDPDLGSQSTWLDVWGDSGMSFCMNISLYKYSVTSSTGFVCLDDTIHRFDLVGSDGNTCVVTMTTYSAEFNGKTRIYLSLYSYTTDTVLMTIKSSGGEINLWNGYVETGEGYFGQLRSKGYPWATNGDSNYTTSDIVSTNSCISAGAFTSKAFFYSLAGGAYDFGTFAIWGHLAPFSSLGPTVDGRIKPDISAPGLCVVSSVNSFDTSYSPGHTNYVSCVSSSHFAVSGRTYYFAELAGTSMASPATSGIIALMLQANPLLAPADIKNIFTQTALQDTFTGYIPSSGNNVWGHGKINAWSAVYTALHYQIPSGISSPPVPALNCKLYPNPNKGSFTLEYSAAGNENVLIEMYDVNGKQVYRDNWNVNAGTNTKNCLVKGLSQGVYFTYLASDSGSTLLKNVVF